MSAMSAVEAAFCRSAPWRGFARRVVLPWALDGTAVEGDVLEIGGGSGAMAEALLDRHPGVRLTVTDIDPGMTSRMRRRFDRFGDRCSVQEADVLDLPHPDGSFDVALSFLMLHHVLEWETALREVHRVLRPGGRLLGYDLVDAPIAAVIHRCDRSPHRLYTADALGNALSVAGFVEAENSTGLLGQVTRFSARSRG